MYHYILNSVPINLLSQLHNHFSLSVYKFYFLVYKCVYIYHKFMYHKCIKKIIRQYILYIRKYEEVLVSKKCTSKVVFQLPWYYIRNEVLVEHILCSSFHGGWTLDRLFLSLCLSLSVSICVYYECIKKKMSKCFETVH